MEHIFEIKQWASSGKAATEVVKTGALYQDKNTQLKLQAQIDTLQSVISKCNRMLGIEPLLEVEYIIIYIKPDNKLTAEERLAAREKHQEYLKTFVSST